MFADELDRRERQAALDAPPHDADRDDDAFLENLLMRSFEMRWGRGRRPETLPLKWLRLPVYVGLAPGERILLRLDPAEDRAMRVEDYDPDESEWQRLAWRAFRRHRQAERGEVEREAERLLEEELERKRREEQRRRLDPVRLAVQRVRAELDRRDAEARQQRKAARTAAGAGKGHRLSSGEETALWKRTAMEGSLAEREAEQLRLARWNDPAYQAAMWALPAVRRMVHEAVRNPATDRYLWAMGIQLTPPAPKGEKAWFERLSCICLWCHESIDPDAADAADRPVATKSGLMHEACSLREGTAARYVLPDGLTRRQAARAAWDTFYA